MLQMSKSRDSMLIPSFETEAKCPEQVEPGKNVGFAPAPWYTTIVRLHNAQY